nr:hypothetical protein [Variovorax sp. E3]
MGTGRGEQALKLGGGARRPGAREIAGVQPAGDEAGVEAGPLPPSTSCSSESPTAQMRVTPSAASRSRQAS